MSTNLKSYQTIIFSLVKFIINTAKTEWKSTYKYVGFPPTTDMHELTNKWGCFGLEFTFWETSLIPCFYGATDRCYGSVNYIFF